MEPKKLTVPDIGRMKAAGERISMVTAYDCPFARLLDEADIVIDLCTPAGDALVHLDGRPETPVGPGSTIAAVAIADAIKVRTAELLLAEGKLPPVITSVAEVGRERSEELFEAAYREHARRAARSLAI